MQSSKCNGCCRRHNKSIDNKEDKSRCHKTPCNHHKIEKCHHNSCNDCNNSCNQCPLAHLANQPPVLYIPGIGFEVLPNVIVEENTILYNKCSFEGKLQQLAFKWAYLYPISITDLDAALETLKEISCPDSQLYFPSQFGFLTNQEQIIADVTTFNRTYTEASVWFPANGWTYDKRRKYGIVESNGRMAYHYRFTVEVQFRQTQIVGGLTQLSVTNDCWSFFVNEDLTKFFQIKEWLDGRVRRIQNQTSPPGQILTLDYNSINLTPFPKIVDGVIINFITVFADTNINQ
jgi:hypothetical protein